MARIRTIKPEFWKHEGLSALPEATHMLAAALLNYADDEGYFNANPALIQAECFPLRDLSRTVPEALRDLSKDGYLKLGTAPNGRRYGVIAHFHEHQTINKKKDSKIKPLAIVWDECGTSTVQIRDEYRGEQGTGNREQGKESMGELKPALPDEFEENFKRLQEIYPKRSGDQRWQTAKKHIRARIKEGSTWIEILDGARRYAAWVKVTGKERTETVKQAATFVGTDKAFMEPFDPPAITAVSTDDYYEKLRRGSCSLQTT